MGTKETLLALLEENKGIPASLLWILATVSGVSVANLYYCQPLLNVMCTDLGISEFQGNLIPMITQIGYALGLLFIIPLGDLYDRRRIIVLNFAVLTLSMSAIGFLSDIRLIYVASLFTGICSVMPQIFIPIASQFSEPRHKARNVGILVSGLLTGILASRVVSGVVGEAFGWRTMYHLAAVFMVGSIFVVLRTLPDMPSNYSGSYGGLMRSLLKLYVSTPKLRVVSIRAGLCFGSFPHGLRRPLFAFPISSPAGGQGRKRSAPATDGSHPLHRMCRYNIKGGKHMPNVPLSTVSNIIICTIKQRAFFPFVFKRRRTVCPCIDNSHLPVLSGKQSSPAKAPPKASFWGDEPCNPCAGVF